MSEVAVEQAAEADAHSISSFVRDAIESPPDQFCGAFRKAACIPIDSSPGVAAFALVLNGKIWHVAISRAKASIT